MFNSNKMKTYLKANLNVDSIIEDVDQRYRKVAINGAIVWLIMTCTSFYLGKITGHLETLTGIERKAPMIAAMLLGMSVFGTALPLIVRGKMKNISGVLLCAIVVHCVAFTTDVLMANFPTPVFLCPVSGTKIYLLRWCEWTPLAFIMTFLTDACRTENLDGKMREDRSTSRLTSILGWGVGKKNESPIEFANDNGAEVEDEDEDEKNRFTQAYILAWTQGLSTACGWLFPFCPGWKSWTILMAISWILYLVMFHRLHSRSVVFAKMKEGTTIAEKEMYHWARLSLGLLKTCTLMWTILVVAYCVYTLGPVMFPKNKFLNMVGLGMIFESIMDVLFKSIYMLIVVEVHDTIFDRSARAERRLEDLRQVSRVDMN